TNGSSVEVVSAVTPVSDLQNRADDIEAERNPGCMGLRYADYLHLDELLGAVQPVSEGNGPSSCANERYFLISHQICELWVSQILVDLDLALECARLADFDGAIDRMTRVNALLELTVTTLRALHRHLAVDAFHQFRPRLQGASAGQSPQFSTVLAGVRYAPVAALLEIIADRHGGDRDSRRQ